MKKISYVILHYKDTDATIDCIKSIKQISTNGKIVVVNNSKGDNSTSTIRKTFGDKNLTIIETETNLGFANGLNRGIEYIKEKHNYDFIVLLNNDTEIITKDFEDKVYSIYNKSNFSVLGPDVVSMDGVHSNPRKDKKYTKIRVLIMVIKANIELNLFRILNIDIAKIANNNRENTKYADYRNNAEIHGSAIILSKNYIKKEGKLFDKTFLYCEESILKYVCDRDNLIICYDPSIKILHKEELATNSISNNTRDKRIFQLKNSYISRKEFYKLIKNDYHERTKRK